MQCWAPGLQFALMLFRVNGTECKITLDDVSGFLENYLLSDEKKMFDPCNNDGVTGNGYYE